MTKKFLPSANNFITKYSRSKTNIVACLDCGSYHEIGCICTKCYEIVKKETQEIHEKILSDDQLRFNYPTKEIEIAYEGESVDETKREKNVIVELPKPRPNWFGKNLLTKVTTK